MRRRRGFGLIELMVVLAILVVILALAAPSFGRWITNLRIRGAAESMLSGIQFARSEATTRNARVRFQITDTLDDSCAITTSGRNWLVDLVIGDAGSDSVAGACGTPASEDSAPHILQVRSATESGSGVAVAADAGADALVLNGIGRLVPAPASTLTIKLTGTDPNDCRDMGGDLTCLHIQISPAGQIRMCNPIFSSGTDPQAC